MIGTDAQHEYSEEQMTQEPVDGALDAPPATVLIETLAPPADPPTAAPAVPFRRGMPVWGWVVLTVAIVAMVVIGAGVAFAVLSPGGTNALSFGPTPLEKAHDSCAKNSDGVAVEDKGRTLTIDTEGQDEYSGASYSEFTCILDALQVPGSVRAKIGHTRAIDGMVSADWDGYSASWNYHPNEGVNIVISMS